ncbi:DUF4352 domain-containing protein [Humibacter sp.]|uniref:DUF4352 domain-containing protein n=1 Tax=Humibacter sp. TaxID=1940291 RepID=UPI002CACE716|nr:DUF4352 domain-containing protein [Humibacter sp.]HVX08372.1 DUF4352 domain-containing protein [Humibacter sp.]
MAKTFRDLISFYKPVTFRSAGTFNLRVVSLAGSGYSKAISRAITLHVQPHFPVVAVNGNSIDARIDAHTRFRDDIGGALYDSSITTCTDYGDGQPYCTTDRPTNGQYLTVPITITQEQGTHDYNRFNYSLKGPDGQVWDQTYEDTKHGQQLSSGTLTAPDYVSGVVVFDVPPGSGYRLLVEDFGDSLGQVYV